MGGSLPFLFFVRLFELELELIHAHMAQKPMLRLEVGARFVLSSCALNVEMCPVDMVKVRVRRHMRPNAHTLEREHSLLVSLKSQKKNMTSNAKSFHGGFGPTQFLLQVLTVARPAAQPRDSVDAALSVALSAAETFPARFLSETKVNYSAAVGIRRVSLHGPKVCIRRLMELVAAR